LPEPVGFISKIQKYATKDGPGLRSTVFMVGCNLRCQWCANPELIEPGPKILYFASRCQQCGTCVRIAANGSIQFSADACQIDRQRCTNLEKCLDACPYEAYEKVGIEISATELHHKLLRDREFYATSGGGVTFSGGEPGLQAEFVAAVAQRLRADGIPVALDTAGLLNWEKLAPLLETVDLVLYDLKAFDSTIHSRCTGVDNRLILENARRIAENGKAMFVRMVLVPGLNDDLNDVEARLRFIQSLGPAVRRVDILKYHKLGVGKYTSLGIPYALADTPLCSDAYITQVEQKALALGGNVVIND
jgi:pyruvate formate lyase activating enzyme